MGKTERGKGTKIMAVADRHGLPISICTESATPHEVRLVQQTLAEVFVEEPVQCLIGDSAYDSDQLDRELAQTGVERIAPHRSNRTNLTQDGRTLRRYRHRWKIERLFCMDDPAAIGREAWTADPPTTSQISCASNNPGAKSGRLFGSRIPNITNWPPIHSRWPNTTLSSFVPERSPLTPLHTKLNQLSLTTMSHQLDQTISDGTGRNLSFPQTLEALADLELEARGKSGRHVDQSKCRRDHKRRITVSETSTLIAYEGKISREELACVPTPAATTTHQPIPHHQIVEVLVKSLSFRQIGVLQEEYSVSRDGMKMFGVLDLEPLLVRGCRFAIGIRNSHDKSMRLGLTIGARVLVCMNMAFHGDFQPLLAKHSKSFSLVDAISVGVDRIQRNFEPMRRNRSRRGKPSNSRAQQRS